MGKCEKKGYGNVEGLVTKMNQINVLRKILNVLYIIVFIMNLAVLGLKWNWQIFIISQLYLLILFGVTKMVGNSMTLIVGLLTLYILIVGPIEIILTEIVPLDIFGQMYKKYIAVTNNKALYWEYFWLSTSMYILILFFYLVLRKVRICSFKIPQIYINYTKNINDYFTLILYSIITYFLRITFRLDIAGEEATISHSGIIVYIYTAVGAYLVYARLKWIEYKNIKNNIKKMIVEVVITILLVSIPDILLDRRISFFMMLITVCLYFYQMYPRLISNYIISHKMSVVLFIFGILLFFEMWTSYIRYDGNNIVSIFYIFSRLTGIAPGLIFLEAWDSITRRFTFGDYLANTFGNRETSITKVFTRDILGYSASAIHSNSLPPFVGVRMYGGILGIILFSFLFAVIFIICDRLILPKEGKNVQHKKKSCFIGCYMLVNTVFIFMEGGAERLIGLFTIPILLAIMPEIYILRYTNRRVSNAD